MERINSTQDLSWKFNVYLRDLLRTVPDTNLLTIDCRGARRYFKVHPNPDYGPESLYAGNLNDISIFLENEESFQYSFINHSGEIKEGKCQRT